MIIIFDFELIFKFLVMSVFGASVILIISGLIQLTVRTFFFVDIKEVDKSKIRNVKLCSLSLISVGTLFIVEGVILLFVFRNHYPDPLAMLRNDFESSKLYIGLFFLAIGSGFLIFRERILYNWREIGIIVPVDSTKYGTFAISIGIVFSLIGLSLIFI